MMHFRYLPVLLMICTLSCNKKPAQSQDRHFYMGITPWPADFTPKDVDDAYTFINDHCDMVCQHFDDGVPYEAAFNNKNWPQEMQKDISTALAKTTPGKTVLLSVSPLALDRKSKADYYSKEDTTNEAVKNAWRALPVNDPKVVTAYVQYIDYLVAQLKPAYVNYGVESNLDKWDPAAFAQYKDFLSKVYAQLKAKYKMPIFISFMALEEKAGLENARQLLPYTDYLTISSYPYLNAGSTANGNTDPKKFPKDFYTRYIDLAPDKPFGIAECGYIAQDLEVPSLNISRKGTDAWQKDYLDMVCSLCEEKKAKFLIWFEAYDYDAGDNTMKKMGVYEDIFAFWQDTGLYDEHRRERPAAVLWKDWMKKPRKD